MIKCKLALCAETVVRDVDTNNISAFTIIDELMSLKFPIVINKISCLFFLLRDDETPEVIECSLRVMIDDEEIHRFPVNMDFQGKKKYRSTVVIGGLLIPRPGNLQFSLYLDEQSVGLWEILVSQSGPQAETQSQTASN